VNILQPKTCPNCREPNGKNEKKILIVVVVLIVDTQLCFKCGFIMSFQAYQKDKEEREEGPGDT
jgi:RNase P subunit RPR2